MQPTDHTSATTAQLQVTVSHTSGFTHIDNLLSYLLSRHTSSVYLFFGHCRLAGRKGIWCVKNPECGNAGDGDLTGALHILSIPVGHHCHLHHSLQQQNPYGLILSLSQNWPMLLFVFACIRSYARAKETPWRDFYASVTDLAGCTERRLREMLTVLKSSMPVDDRAGQEVNWCSTVCLYSPHSVQWISSRVYNVAVS